MTVLRWARHALRGAAAVWLCASPAGVAGAQDVALITVAGQKQILANPGSQPAGARKPDVTVVEYFDYNCPFCKKVGGELQSLVAQDPNVAVVYKDWPILGTVSVYASTSALAAGYQGKYLVAHDALQSGPRLAQNSQVDEILQRAGLDMDALRKDRVDHAKAIAALLARNAEEARALALDGTPGILVGRQLLPGSADVNELKHWVAQSRQGK
jgi:protein-disulfide isomerase